MSDTDFHALTKPSDILVLNMLEHVGHILEPYASKYLEPYVSGLYLKGNINPLLVEGITYYKDFVSDSQAKRDKLSFNGIPFNSLAEIMQCNKDVYDSRGNIVITAKDLFFNKRFIDIKPSIPVQIIKVAIAVVLEYLNSLNKHTNVNSINYNLNRLVKSKHRDLIVKEYYQTEFINLIDKVAEFVGADSWHIYFYKINGTSLVISKTIDFRIYDWYRIKNEAELTTD